MGDEPKPKKLPQLICAFAAGTGAAAAGTTIGWIANIQDHLETEGYNNFVFSKEDSSWTGSLVLLAGLVMSLASGVLADILGRKLLMLIMAAPLILGWVVIVFAQNIYMIFAGRFITGLSLGAFCVAAPMYTSEIAHVSIRGALGTFFQLFLVLGILVTLVTGYLFNVMIHTIIAACLAGGFFVILFFQPESPVFLMKKNKKEAAEKALQRLRGKDYDVSKELNDIEKNVELQKSQQVHIKEALKTKAAKKSIMIVFMSQLIQQVSGINVVGIYTSAIFQDAGVKKDHVPLCSIGYAVVNLLSTYAATMLIERFGRKTLLLASAFFLGLCVLAMGLFLMVKERELASKDSVDSASWVAIIALILYICFFEIGLGPIPWLLAPEILPPDIKGIMSSAAGAFSWFLGFCFSRFYSPISGAIGSDICFLFFAAGEFLGCVFIWFFVFETRGLSMEEIQEMMNK